MPSTVTIHPWPDPLLDATGHDPRSAYVETFWLPTLGPTALLLLRHLSDRLDGTGGRFELHLAETARALGLGARDGSSSPLVRSLGRLELFELACSDGSGNIAVRRHVASVNPRHLRRLPPALQAAHAEWDPGRCEPEGADPRQRSRRIAVALVEQGDHLDRVERVLLASGFGTALARESAAWAWERHRVALTALTGTEPR
ncbi:MAG: hypothetical protein U0V73_04985 [Acidimicrobiia bacterium]